MDPPGCADGIINIVDAFCNTANDILQMTADCTMPGLDEAACASDVTGFLANTFSSITGISDTVIACGAEGDECLSAVTTVLSDFSTEARILIAASVDCTTDPFTCTFDVVTAIDVLNTATLDIIASLRSCDTPYIPRGYDETEMQDDWFHYDSRMGLYRRLTQQQPQPNATAGIKRAGPRASFGHGRATSAAAVAATAVDPGLTLAFARLVEEHGKVQDDFWALRERLGVPARSLPSTSGSAGTGARAGEAATRHVASASRRAAPPPPLPAAPPPATGFPGSWAGFASSLSEAFRPAGSVLLL